MMNHLPLEIIHHILDYTGKIKYRHGKYMNRIDPEDERYRILQTMPQIKPYKHHFWYMTITDKRNKIYCEKHIYSAYMEKEPVLINTYIDTWVISYCYCVDGFHYEFIIYKPQQPTLVKYVLQNIFMIGDHIHNLSLQFKKYIECISVE